MRTLLPIVSIYVLALHSAQHTCSHSGTNGFTSTMKVGSR